MCFLKFLKYTGVSRKRITHTEQLKLRDKQRLQHEHSETFTNLQTSKPSNIYKRGKEGAGPGNEI